MKPVNIAVAVSGGGRSLANLLEQERSGKAKYKITCVVSSKSDCKAVSIAETFGLPVFLHRFPQNHDLTLDTSLEVFLKNHQVSWIVLAGFLRPMPVLSAWRSKIVNIHPALLPKFGGKGMYGHHVHNAVLNANELRSGATVHFVNETYDDGAIIAQVIVPVKKDDTVETLAERVFAGECKLYPEVLNALVSGTLPEQQNKVFVMDLTNEQIHK
jgi:phosphoribosylglycinamide formyltransferase-1